MADVRIIDGPTIPEIAGDPLYQVTLASGAIATRPGSFPGDGPTQATQEITVAQDGEVLRPRELWAE